MVFDGVGGLVGREALEALAPGGRFSVHGAASGASTLIDAAEATRRGVRVIGIEQLWTFGSGAMARVERVVTEAAASRIRPVIGQTIPLERAADAHAAMEARTVLGKSLLVI